MTTPLAVEGEEDVMEGGDVEEAGGMTDGREFPDEFYDPTTNRIMLDPVVNPAGDSCDKPSAVVDSSITYYSNRALKNIIAHDTEIASGSMRGNLQRIDESVRTGISRLMENSITGGGQYRPLPDYFYCPITCDLIVDPVITPYGNSYERTAITLWAHEHGMSPITRSKLTISELRPNNALYELIQKEKGRPATQMHPDIHRWIESGLDTSTRNVVVELPPAPSIAEVRPSAAAGTAAPANTPDLPPTRAEARAMKRRIVGTFLCFVALFFAIVYPRALSIAFLLMILALCFF